MDDLNILIVLLQALIDHYYTDAKFIYKTQNQQSWHVM